MTVIEKEKEGEAVAQEPRAPDPDARQEEAADDRDWSRARLLIARALLAKRERGEIIEQLAPEGFDDDEADELVEEVDEDLDFIVQQREQGKLKAEIIRELTSDGWDEKGAIEIVVSIEEEYFQKEELRQGSSDEVKRQASKKMLWGGAWIALGLVVTLVTYASADSVGGGTYILFWGPIVYGAIELVRGVIQHGSA